MKERNRWWTVAALTLGISMMATGCGSNQSTANAGADTDVQQEVADNGTADSSVAESSDNTVDTVASGALDLNSLSMDEIIQKAKEEGHVESVGMPDTWANWGLSWTALEDNYGITHADSDMSSAEELQMFATEGANGTKDIGDVGQAFGAQAIEEDLVQGYKTSYWDSVPDWAKGEDGKWMIAYTGATTFLTNTDLVTDAPTSWADIRQGDYTVAIGDINGGNAQAAVVASAYAFGGDLNNLDPAFEFWTE